MRERIHLIETLAAQCGPIARVVLMQVRGGSSRKAGAVLWVAADRRSWGGVTVGGCLEGWLVERSVEVLAEGTPRRIPVELGAEGLIDPGLSCSGSAELLIEPVDLHHPANPVRIMYREIRAATDRGRRVVAITRLDSPGERILVVENQVLPALPEPVGQGAIAMLAQGSPGARVIPGANGETDFLLELFCPAPILLLFGAGPIAAPLGTIATTAGFRVVVVDSRRALLTRERFPDVDELVPRHPAYAVDSLSWGANTFAVVASHNPSDEIPVIEHALREGAAYIGFVGSRERGERMLRYLAENGVDPGRLARVRVPVGLDVGAESPGAIAVSIVADLLAVRHGRSGGPLPRAHVAAPAPAGTAGAGAGLSSKGSPA